MTEAIAGFWQAVGLKVNVQILEFSKYLDVLFDKTHHATSLFIEHDNALFDADRTLSAYYEPGGIANDNNVPEIIKLADDGRTETDVQKRLADYQQALKLGCDQARFVFLVNSKDAYGASQRLRWTPRVDGRIIVKDMSLAS